MVLVQTLRGMFIPAAVDFSPGCAISLAMQNTTSPKTAKKRRHAWKIGMQSLALTTGKRGHGPMRAMRLRAGFSIQALALKADVHRNTILRAEQRGGWPKGRHALRDIRAALGVAS